jgi:DNA polymerase-3 subunit gamma/tau
MQRLLNRLKTWVSASEIDFMAYQALYRKWRPGEFDDVKGQDHIVTTLRNQIKMNRIGHAYLFCGTRGTGKTTVAKIFAKAVNCLSPVDGGPCNECAMCKAINEQTSMNVIEIDAASNNGVDNIREIREEVGYSPTEGKYKVYIIDEVHMLSIGAFNALLKTLEEPPSYVIFILATTEAHKIPITILSRCQRYDFKRITVDTISDRLTELIEKEGMDVEDRAVRYIARAADGAMRDALSLLDQCASFYINERLTYDRVLEVLGAVDTTVFSKLLRCIIANDVTGSIYLLEDVIIQGRELSQFVTDFIWYMRNLLLAQSSDDLEDVLDISSENMASLKEEAQMVDANTLMRYIRVFSELSGQIRYSTQKRVLLEVALVKLCKPAMERNYDSILNRLSVIEKQLASGVVVAAGTAVAGNANASEAGADMSEAAPQAAERPQAMSEDIKQLIDQWGRIVSDLSGSAAAMIKTARVSQGEGGTIILGFDQDMKKSYFDEESHRKEIEDIISEKIQKNVQIKPVLIGQQEAGQPTQDMFFDPRKFNLDGVDIVYEDD